MATTETVVCRLCMSTESGQLKILAQGDIVHKIKQCLSIEVNVGDTLPKFVCQSCITKVEDMYMYQLSCLQTQSILEKKLLKHQTDLKISGVSKVEVGELQNIVGRLQSGNSALSVTPVGLYDMTDRKNPQNQCGSPSAVSITPILTNREKNGDNDREWTDSASSESLPCIRNPHPEDYILIQEEIFTIDPSERNPDFWENTDFNKDSEILKAQWRRRVVLPPMWDVYDRSSDTESITHRRYILSSRSFPCSLCGTCFKIFSDKSQLQHSTEKKMAPLEETLALATDTQDAVVNENFSSGNQNEEQLMVAQDSKYPLGLQEFGVFDCQECGKSFPRRQSWKRHIQSHSESKAFFCSICGKRFSRKEHLSRHVSSHSGGRPFNCGNCHKSFSRKEHLARHLACNPTCLRSEKSRNLSTQSLLDGDPKSVSSKVFTCNICVQSFVHKEHMIRHYRRVHPVVDATSVSLSSKEVNNKQQFRSKSYTVTHFEKKGDHVQLSHGNLKGISSSYGAHQNSLQGNVYDENYAEIPEQIEVEVRLVEDVPNGGSILQGLDLQSMEYEDMSSNFSHLGNRTLKQNIQSQETNKNQLKVNQMSCSETKRFHQDLGEFRDCSDLARASSYHSRSSDEERGNSKRKGSAAPSVSLEESVCKGDQHACSICGKTFGRRYHLVRHNKSQHGVESVKVEQG